MCSENHLAKILSSVAQQTQIALKEKLDSLILFGSYARGDFDDESDIDIMILADIDSAEVNAYTRKIYDLLYETRLDTDCVLSLCIVPKERFHRFKETVPFYRNVEREGVKIAV